MYDAVNWGTEHHVIDAKSGAEAAPSLMPAETPEPASQLDPTGPLPRPDARLLSGALTGGAALYVANAWDGSHLWLCGGAGQLMSSCVEIWRANEWMREIKTGRVESSAYTASDGTPLTAWRRLPPDYAPGHARGC